MAGGIWRLDGYLKLWPQVVTGHLIGGFTTLSLMWLLFLRQGACQVWCLRCPAELAGEDRICRGGRADHFGRVGFLELRCTGLL